MILPLAMIAGLMPHLFEFYPNEDAYITRSGSAFFVV